MAAPPTLPRSRNSTLTALLFAILAVVLMGSLMMNRRAARVDGEAALASWRIDLPTAIAEAERARRPLLLFFTASWCEPCRMVRERVLPLPRVHEVVHGRFVPVVIDVTKATAADDRLMKDMKIEGIPTFAVIRPDTRPIAVTVVPQDPGEVIRWLNESADNFALSTKPLATQTAPSR